MLRKLLPLVVISAMIGAAWFIFSNPPAVDRSPRARAAAMTVQVETIKPQNYQLIVKRYGRVLARQRTSLVAEAAGKVTYIAPELRSGGQLSKGQLLLKLDDSRYQAELAIAEASLTESLQNLADEEAQAIQAKQAWSLSGQPGEPSERVLRVPQLKAARAQVASARSSVRLAKIALQDTRLTAPFAAKVASVAVEVGQAISSGSEIATLIADRAPEIEVALHQRDLDYLSPETEPPALVQDEVKQYQGSLLRTAAELDSASQQLMATVTLDGPVSSDGNNESPQSWPQVGRLVEVAIDGTELKDVIVIPNGSVYQSRYVYVVEKRRLKRREVTISWHDDLYSVVSSGLQPGEQLVLTPLGQVTSGIRVAVTEKSEGQQP
ncbi:efflux RND transporter periplasmic adaptor subunit [Oceanospirillum linum]|uniref:Membrane fusion protein biotin-lipoyl like domain-containing protein n=1 Tax=Oceanospirillum linum TaxID=966 RepID=A0A1T1HCG3_OCELI|nr:efflux RND transporter periplasmic adaptor subunit [Oceanospirillum linum]OOV87493.1 hypothetical protein BTA35_0205475 [Oceanospirillum linum]SEF89738.1 RND family efflux transporter, MFP subunit [Oleiphilus messinensis]SMP13599.1 RND family efflux transporter, MFP subunit [Oceanospirillum linum]